MRKYFITILVSMLLLSSCSIDWKDEKDKKISELEKQIINLKQKNEDDLFKKKQECNKNFINYQQYLSSLNAGASIIIDEIFYSPKLNTCIGGTTIGDSYYIDDVLTKKEFINKDGLYGWSKRDYDIKIKELKGEQ